MSRKILAIIYKSYHSLVICVNKERMGRQTGNSVKDRRLQSCRLDFAQKHNHKSTKVVISLKLSSRPIARMQENNDVAK